MMREKMDPKDMAIEELMAYLDGKDKDSLGGAMKPDGESMMVTKMEKMGDGGEPDGDEMSPEVMADSKPGMSDEEMDELIQAIQSKLGS